MIKSKCEGCKFLNLDDSGLLEICTNLNDCEFQMED